MKRLVSARFSFRLILKARKKESECITNSDGNAFEETSLGLMACALKPGCLNMQCMPSCALCKREVARVTRHHLIPRARHRSRKKREDVGCNELHRVIDICWPCHKHIHAVLTEKELEGEYNTIEKLASYPQVARFLEWVRKQADAPIRVRSSRAKRERRKQGA